MNLTIITILLPYPLTSGGAQAQYNMIDVLRKRCHITIIFPQGGQNHKWALKKLQAQWPEVTFFPYSYFRQLHYLPFFIDKTTRFFNLIFNSKSEVFQKERILKPYGYVINDNFIRFVNNIINNQHTDIVQVEFYPFLKLAPYLPKTIKKIFVHHEIRFIRNERNLKQFELNNSDIEYMSQLKTEEINDLNKFDKIATLTNVDKDILLTNGVSVPIAVSPAAVNAKILPYKGWNNTLVFLGGMGHAPNVEGLKWLSHQVLPLIDWQGKFHNVCLNIIGKGWNKEIIAGIPEHNVCLKGFVPQLEEAAYGGIMIVPILSGSGMRMKILEAAALGMPIISTSVGIEGINMTHGESCIIADKPDEFAQGLIKLMTDNQLREHLAITAQSIYLKYYSKEALASIRENLYKI